MAKKKTKQYEYVKESNEGEGPGGKKKQHQGR